MHQPTLGDIFVYKPLHSTTYYYCRYEGYSKNTFTGKYKYRLFNLTKNVSMSPITLNEFMYKPRSEFPELYI